MVNRIPLLQKNPLVKRIFAYGFSDSISKIAPFIVIPIIIRYLTPEDYGYITNFIAISNLFIPVILLNGHTYYSIQFNRTPQDKRGNLLWNILYINTFLLLLLSVVTPFLKDMFLEHFELSIVWVYLAIAFAFLSSIIMLFQTMQRMFEKVRDFSLVKIGNSLLSAFLAILFVILLGLSWQGRVTALVITSIVTVVVCVYFCTKYSKNIFTINKSYIQGFLLFSLPLLPHSLAGWGKSAVEKGMVTSMISIGENGLLGIAGISLSMISVATTAIFSAFNPEVLKLLTQIDLNDDKKRELEKKIVKMSLAVVAGMTLLIALNYPLNYLFFKYYLDDSYLGGLKYVPFLLLSSFFGLFYALFSLYIMNEKKTAALSYITVSTTLVQIGTTYVTLKYSGVMAMVIANSGVTLLQSTIVVWYANKIRPLPWLKAIKIK